MESRKIAEALEKIKPSPSLHLDSPYQARVEKILPDFANSIRPIFMPLVPKTFLNPRSQEYFVATREKNLGMPLEKYAEGAEEALNSAKPHIKQLGDLLKEHPEGPFLEGKTPVYADFVVVGLLKMLHQLGWADRVLDTEGGQELKKLYEASSEWLERDSY